MRSIVPSGQASVRSPISALANRTRSSGAIPAMCRSEPAPIQTSSCRSRLLSISTRVTFGAGNGATAPGSNPVAATTSSGLAARPCGSREPVRVHALVARNEREHRAPVADEDERLDDLGALAAAGARGGAGGRRAGLDLLQARVHGRLAQGGGEALDRLRPGLHGITVVNATDLRPSPLCCLNG